MCPRWARCTTWCATKTFSRSEATTSQQRVGGVTMAGEFSGKVAVITGGSRGIGREIAVDFARHGAQTVIVSSSADNLAAASKTVAAAKGPAPLAITADLRKLEGCQQVFNTVKDKF